MNKSALVIYLKTSYPMCDEIKLTKYLLAMQFLGNPLNQSNYQGGAHFLNYISFIGCSPVVALNHQINENHSNFIYVELKWRTEAVFYHKNKFIVPNCPKCEKQIMFTQHSITQDCHFCKTPLQLEQLDWKKRAFFSSAAIIIHGVFENEAIPDSQFMAALQEFTQCQWLSMFIVCKNV